MYRLPSLQSPCVYKASAVMCPWQEHAVSFKEDWAFPSLPWLRYCSLRKLSLTSLRSEAGLLTAVVGSLGSGYGDNSLDGGQALIDVASYCSMPDAFAIHNMGVSKNQAALIQTPKQ